MYGHNILQGVLRLTALGLSPCLFGTGLQNYFQAL